MFQELYPYFMITETNKNLEYIEIKCIQMHELWAGTTTEEGGHVQDGEMYYTSLGG